MSSTIKEEKKQCVQCVQESKENGKPILNYGTSTTHSGIRLQKFLGNHKEENIGTGVQAILEDSQATMN